MAARLGVSSSELPVAGAPRPFFSVIVTAYHRRTFLREAVRSVLDQDLDRSDFEVVVVKDFVDAELEAELAATSGSVRVHTENLERMGEMISKGVELARGEVVCFIEDDDRFRPGKLRGLRELFRRSPEVGFVRNSYVGIDAEGHALPSWERLRPQPPRSLRLSPSARGPGGLAFVFRYGIHINLSTMAIRRELLVPWLPRFREVPASPDLFVFLLGAISDRVVQVESERWNDYRVHASTSHSALREGNEEKDLADTLRSEATARVMERLLSQGPAGALAERFVECFHEEVAATTYVLDPTARWSVRGWFAFLRTAFWRRQRYLLVLAAFATYRAVFPTRAVRSYRRWRYRALRTAAGTAE